MQKDMQPVMHEEKMMTVPILSVKMCDQLLIQTTGGIWASGCLVIKKQSPVFRIKCLIRQLLFPIKVAFGSYQSQNKSSYKSRRLCNLWTLSKLYVPKTYQMIPIFRC